jgi:hypothetical protein
MQGRRRAEARRHAAQSPCGGCWRRQSESLGRARAILRLLETHELRAASPASSRRRGAALHITGTFPPAHLTAALLNLISLTPRPKKNKRAGPRIALPPFQPHHPPRHEAPEHPHRRQRRRQALRLWCARGGAAAAAAARAVGALEGAGPGGWRGRGVWRVLGPLSRLPMGLVGVCDSRNSAAAPAGVCAAVCVGTICRFSIHAHTSKGECARTHTHTHPAELRIHTHIHKNKNA